ncbi:MAG: NepR family anti-sigma factor [Pseudomonadota bacterium]
MTQGRRDRKVDQEIDDNLRRAFSDLENQPIPDRLTTLLEQLRSQGPAAGKPTAGDADE